MTTKADVCQHVSSDCWGLFLLDSVSLYLCLQRRHAGNRIGIPPNVKRKLAAAAPLVLTRFRYSFECRVQMLLFPISCFPQDNSARKQWSCVPFIALCLAIAAQGAWAAPQINNVNLRGIRTDGTTTLVIDGAGLSHDTRLVLGAAIDAQSVKPGATDKRIEVELTLSKKFQPGFYLLRAYTLSLHDALPI